MNNNYCQPQNYERSYSPSISIREKNTNTNQYPYTSALLKSRIGENATIYTSFPDSIEWRDKVFKGKIIAVGEDYTLIRDTSNIERLIINIYINYIEFNL